MSELSRQEAKQKSRVALLAAGMELFAEQGLDGPSLDVICKKAGYTRGAFYGHFKDREDFMVAVMEAVGRPLVDTLAKTEGDEGLAVTTQRFMQAYLDGTYPLSPAGRFKPHQLLDASARYERIRLMYLDLMNQAIALLEKAAINDQKHGRLQEGVDTHALASVLVTLAIGYQSVGELGGDLEVASVAQLILSAFRPASRSD
jgi:TetR/AcrR family transcriptional repressor of nem operon